MFQSFLSSLATSKYLSGFHLSSIFTQWSAETAKSSRWQAFYFILNQHKVWPSGLHRLIRFLSQSHRDLYTAHRPCEFFCSWQSLRIVLPLKLLANFIFFCISYSLRIFFFFFCILHSLRIFWDLILLVIFFFFLHLTLLANFLASHNHSEISFVSHTPCNFSFFYCI